MAASYITTYQQYLQRESQPLSEVALAQVEAILHQTCWEEPQSALDCNNSAVVALIEAEISQDATMRSMYLEMAIAALQAGAEHPLCAAHLALVQNLVGARDEALQIAFSTFIEALLPAFGGAEAVPPGLIYLPRGWRGYFEATDTELDTLLMTPSGDQQAVLLLGQVLAHSQFVFYNSGGLRFLQLAAHLLPQNAALNLSLGISSLVNGQWEGLLYLHRAHQQTSNCSPVLQSLYLAYSDLGQTEIAEYWRSQAQALPEESSQWAQLSIDSPFTYVQFETMHLAVEPSYQSIVTSVLLAQGTWFEREMEFWQDQIQPGMTVIDVGANVGVYTFSAAQRVGATGRVLAVEPFSGCVRCLEETRRLSQLKWVTICRGAASDRDGTAKLALHTASELNQVLTESETTDGVEEVPCFSLDTLLKQEQLQRVDMLKIDAEGHELQVLQGSDRLLREFAPTILYENIAGSQGSNLPVANFLTENGYQLFRYQPYVKQLIPVTSEADLQGTLNVIALPKSSG